MLTAFLRLTQTALVGSCLLPLAAVFFTRLQTNERILDVQFLVKFAVCALGAAGFCGAVWFSTRKFFHRIEHFSARQAAFLDGLAPRWVDWSILVSAAGSLFLELAVIRWQGTLFSLFAFYKNIGLLACFAGLGLGYALADRKHIPLFLALPLFAWQIALLTVLRYSGEGLHARSLMAAPITEQLNMILQNVSGASSYVPIYLFLACVFLLTALAFVPVGQVCGRTMMRRPNLRAYGLNLVGSVVGVLAISAVSYFWAPPTVWFAIGFLGLLVFQTFSVASAVQGVAVAVAGLAVLAWPVAPSVDRVYSPYQLVERHGEGNWMKICASGLHYQVALDLSFDNPERKTVPFYRAASKYYELPYQVFEARRGKPGRVAIVGTGTGNDVAGALRMGAQQVDAIEIDPAIMEIGARFHPEKPYSDPRVHAIVNDARSFFRQTDETYDLVVYGFLDSHSALSHASGVRVDSFVYTVEGIREARARLKDGGLMSLTFNVIAPELGHKIYLMMRDAFDGRPPVCVKAKEEDYGAVTFLEGNGWDLTGLDNVPAAAGFEDCTAQYRRTGALADLPTDDWPFFYMPRRVYPLSYVGMLGLILLLSAVLVASFFRGRPRAGHGPFFFLGAGFMLVETKGITELGLTFGNTWQVIAVVITAILTMAFLANCLVVLVKPRRPYVAFAFLLAGVGLGFFVSWRGGFSSTHGGRLATVLVLTCPLLFSGIVFSTLLRTDTGIAGAMAANLLGAMCGGLLEYNAMYFGFRFLYVLAGILYFAAFLAYLVAVRTPSDSPLEGRKPA
jgi:spermidine synthase